MLRSFLARAVRMSFFDLCVAVLLFFNAVAILNEERFLAKRAFSRRGPHGACFCRCALAPGVLRHVASLLLPCARGPGRWLALPRLCHRRAGRHQHAERTGTGPHQRGVVHARCVAELPARVSWQYVPEAARCCGCVCDVWRTVVPLTVINSVVILVKLVFG